MSEQPTFDVFLSYSSKDEAVVRSIAERLRQDGLRVWFDGWEIQFGDNIPAKIEDGLQHSRVLVLFMSANAFGAAWAQLETQTFRFSDPMNKERRFIPLRLDNAEIKGSLAQFFYIDWRFSEYHDQQYAKLLEKCRPPARPESPAITPIVDAARGKLAREDFLKNDKRWHMEVFAIELLKRPVSVDRNDMDHVTVSVDRRDVDTVLFSTAGKNEAVEEILAKTDLADLKERDKAIQEFLVGDTVGSRKVDVPAQLRWASGGVLSIVSFADDPKKKKWVPLYFRDIRPYGWNISLGSTQRAFHDDNLTVDADFQIEDEWREPAQYIEREFLEETLLVAGETGEQRNLTYRPFFWADAHGQARVQGEIFGEKLRRIRAEADNLTFVKARTPAIELRPKPVSHCTLEVVTRGGKTFSTDNVLVCFSLLDLGIEVVRVVEYVLNKGDSFLDGEILDETLKNGEPYQEPVRMPLALLSLKYLEDVFGKSLEWQENYTDGPQPSIEVRRPAKEDIRVFPWDVKKRLEIINSSPVSEREKKEKARLVLWYDKFRDNFLDKPWEPARPSGLFIPGTAKILSLYFNMVKKKNAKRGSHGQGNQLV